MFQTMNRVASAPSCSAFIHRIALEEVSAQVPGGAATCQEPLDKQGALPSLVRSRLRPQGSPVALAEPCHLRGCEWP